MKPILILVLACSALAGCATPDSVSRAAQNLGSTQHQPAD
jgi:hypothetical protein